jgi:hypothetical protein
MRPFRAVLVAVSAAVLTAGLLAPSTFASASAQMVTFGGGTGNFGDVTVGKYVEQTITLTSDTDGTTFTGSPIIDGPSPDEFVIQSEDCTGATLDSGASCDVTIAAEPQFEGERDASLSVTTVPGGVQTKQITVNGLWTNTGAFYPVVTTRILDTRTGNGVSAPGQVHQGATIDLQVAGRGGVPVTGASAVVLNLTVTGPTSGGYVTAYPTSGTKPLVSTINFPRGWTGANSVTVPLGTGGKVSLFNCCGNVSLIADVVGWYAATDAKAGGVFGKTYQTVRPERLYDSRAPGEHKLAAHSWVEFDMGYGQPWDPTMTAFVSTVTALNAGSTGYLTAYRPGTDPTKTSTLNFRPGVTTPNLAITRTAPCHESWCTFDGDPVVRFYNGSSKPVDILIDAVGFYSDTHLEGGLRYKPLTPTRIIDTRKALGTNKFGPASTHVVFAPANVAGDDTYALSANVTAIKPTVRTFETLWPKFTNFPRPTVSQLNPSAGATVAQATMTEVGPGNLFNIYNASGSVDLAMDVSGSFEIFPPSVSTPAFAKGPALRVSAVHRGAPTVGARASASTAHRQP